MSDAEQPKCFQAITKAAVIHTYLTQLSVLFRDLQDLVEDQEMKATCADLSVKMGEIATAMGEIVYLLWEDLP